MERWNEVYSTLLPLTLVSLVPLFFRLFDSTYSTRLDRKKKQNRAKMTCASSLTTPCPLRCLKAYRGIARLCRPGSLFDPVEVHIEPLVRNSNPPVRVEPCLASLSTS